MKVKVLLHLQNERQWRAIFLTAYMSFCGPCKKLSHL